MNTSGLLQSTRKSVHGIMNTSGLLQSYREALGLHLLCKRPEVFMIPWTDHIKTTYLCTLKRRVCNQCRIDTHL